MKKQSDIQKENVKLLLKLTAENPELRIFPMVNEDVVAGDEYSYWVGSWGEPELDEMWCDGEAIYFKSRDCEDLDNQYIDCHDEDLDDLYYEEIEAEAKEHTDNLPWEKVIVVRIELP